jgi:hypothetical protein
MKPLTVNQRGPYLSEAQPTSGARKEGTMMARNARPAPMESCPTNQHCKFQESVKELRASELFWLLRHNDKQIMRAPETAPRLSAPIRKTAN